MSIWLDERVGAVKGPYFTLSILILITVHLWSNITFYQDPYCRAVGSLFFCVFLLFHE